MTNEQLYVLLGLYRSRLLEIERRLGHLRCDEGGNAFTKEIFRLAEEMWSDMQKLKSPGYDDPLITAKK